MIYSAGMKVPQKGKSWAFEMTSAPWKQMASRSVPARHWGRKTAKKRAFDWG
jgi:hypothetical protein